MRIALFGGSFNPPHVSHIEAAKKISTLFDKVIIVPCYIQPFKGPLEFSPEQRLKLCSIAFSKIPNVEISEVELKEPKPSYTVETLDHFKREFPDDEFTFVLGEDSMATLLKWKDPIRLTQLCSFLILKREGFLDTDVLGNVIKTLNPEITFLDTVLKEVSSTEIREKLKVNASLRGLVPAEIETYLKAD